MKLSHAAPAPHFGLPAVSAPAKGTTASVLAIWLAVLVASLFSPDLVYDPEQKHLAIAALTWWFWGAASTALVLSSVALRHRKASAPADPLWYAPAVAIAAIWLVTTLLGLLTERQVTGSDPTQFPAAAVFGPVVAMLATGVVAGHVAGTYSERTLLGITTVAALIAITAVGMRVIAMPEPLRASAPLDQFSSGRALPHLEAMAREPSPTGSEANARVRDYIIGEIRALGLAPEVQSTVAFDADWGIALQVENVLVRLPGSDSTKAVLIVAHYDGVASGPATGDNKLAVAAMLEAMRALRTVPQLRNDVIFLSPDGEEYGLVGAKAFVEEHPWAGDVGVVFNYDASDGRGPLVLQQTSEDDGWLVSNMDSANAGIFLKSQQNSDRSEWGQDFDVFEEAGYTAANLNNWTNQSYYHTRLDNIANLDEGKLQAYGNSMVQLARRFGGLDLRDTRGGDRVFTSMFDKDFVVSYPKSWTVPLTVVATAGVAAVLILGVRRGRLGTMPLVKSGAALIALVLVSALVAEVAWSVIKGTHLEADWQQEVDIYQGNMMLGGLVALVAAGFIAFLVWSIPRFGLANLQAAALVPVLLVAYFGAAADQFFSYIALWPLLAVTVAVGVTHFIPGAETGRFGWLRAAVFGVAAVVVLGVYAPVLWQTMFRSTDSAAALPIIAAVLIAGLLVSLIDLALPSPRLWLSGVAVALAVALLAVGLARSGFSADQPRPHTIFYAMNADTGTANWATLNSQPDQWIRQFVPKDAQKTTAEAVVGVPATEHETTDWLPTSLRAWSSPAPTIDAQGPALTVLRSQQEGETRTLALRLTSPRGARVLALVAQQDVLSASVEGKQIDVTEGWRFMFVGLPAEGVELELTLRGQGPTRLVVFDQTDGLPRPLVSGYGAEPADTMPAILPQWVRGYPTFVSAAYVLE